MRRTLVLILAVFLPSGVVLGASTNNCVPPPVFVDVPHPAIAPAEQMISHTEEITIDRPLAVALKVADEPLKNAVHHTGALPGVAGDYVLSGSEFGAPGSRRMVCLTDGSTLEEQSLERERTDATYRFRYVVWNYTTEKARPISYSVGTFLYSETADHGTHITWTYSFELNRNRFPGYLGGVGDFLFRVGFLDRQYAELMRGTLDGFKSTAESRDQSELSRRKEDGVLKK